MRTILALLLAAPLAALAQPSQAPEASSKKAPDHSIGAGLVLSGSATTSYVSLLGSSPTARDPAVNMTGPAFVGTFEQRLGGSTWFILGITARYERFRNDLLPDTEKLTTVRADAWELGVQPGIRYVLTKPGSLVDVSFLGQAALGAWSRETVTQGVAVATLLPPTMEATPPRRQKETYWCAGGSVGIAVDRQLTDSLSVRVATPIVEAMYVKGSGEVETAELDGVGGAVNRSPGGTGFVLQAVMVPQIELRLSF